MQRKIINIFGANFIFAPNYIKYNLIHIKINIKQDREIVFAYISEKYASFAFSQLRMQTLRSGQGGQNKFAYVSEHLSDEKKKNLNIFSIFFF